MGALSGRRSLRPERVADRFPSPLRRRVWLWAGLALLCALLVGLVAAIRVWRQPGEARIREVLQRHLPEDPEEARLLGAVASRPADPGARGNLGGYYERQARPFEAVWEYAEAARLAPADLEMRRSMSASLAAGRLPGPAAETLAELLRTRPGDLLARRQLAQLRLQMGDPEAALALLAPRREELWRDPEAARELGQVYEAAGQPAQAVAAYQEVTRRRPHDGEAYYRLGRLLRAAGKPAEARDALFHARVNGANRGATNTEIGEAYLAGSGRGDLEHAISFLEEAARDGSAEAFYQLGLLERRRGRPRQAVNRFSQALMADGTLAETCRAMAQTLTAMGQPAEAHRYMGRYYDLMDNSAAAIAEYRAWQSLQPANTEPALRIGEIHVRDQQNERAATLTEAALARDPRNTRLLERLIALKIAIGDRIAARRLCSDWMKQDPKAAAPYWLMGRAALGDVRYEEGARWLEEAVRRAPDNVEVLGFLGAALQRIPRRESRERSVEVLAHAMALNPDHAEYRELLAHSLRQLGQHDLARRQFLRALDADPRRVTCYNAAAQLAWQLRSPGAGALFARLVQQVQEQIREETLRQRQVLDHPRSAEARLALGRFLMGQGRLAPAEVQIADAVALRPGWPEATRLLARLRRVKAVL